jgi:hypothetical protein
MRLAGFKAGDWVVYRKLKHSASPGPRASNVSPSLHGELYSYFVAKFWIVEEVLADGRLRLRTRRGKTRMIDASDPNLRRATWWQRWIYKYRFREIQAETNNSRH